MMRKLIIGIAGLVCLAVVVVGYRGIAASDPVAPEVVGDTQTAPSAKTTDPTEATTASESSVTSASNADVALTEETVAVEVEPERDQAKAAEPAVNSVEIPRPQNQLADGEYRWSQLLPRDAIFPVYEPQFAPADEAPYADDELVIGLEINGEAKAYAIGPLNSREMVNDTVGGVPVLVTW